VNKPVWCPSRVTRRRWRQEKLELPIIYLAHTGRPPPEVEAQWPPDVTIVRERFTAEKLRAAVSAKLHGGGDGKPPV
jgi:hypothetical protein